MGSGGTELLQRRRPHDELGNLPAEDERAERQGRSEKKLTSYLGVLHRRPRLEDDPVLVVPFDHRVEPSDIRRAITVEAASPLQDVGRPVLLGREGDVLGSACTAKRLFERRTVVDLDVGQQPGFHLGLGRCCPRALLASDAKDSHFRRQQEDLRVLT